MKLTAFFILAACLHVNATDGYGQKVTLSEREVHIEKILTEIKKQTGFTFLYTSNILANTKRVSVKVINATVNEVLDLALAGQGLEYRIKGEDRLIIIKTKPPVQATSKVVQINDGPIDEVRGVITDENGAPAAGVNVVVKGTNKGTTTNFRGEFVLRDVNEGAILLVSSVGYDRQELFVKDNKFIRAQLRVAVGNLDEMQVIAYGKTSKRFNTGNVSTIKSSEIEMQPVNNPLLALQGRVPGLFISQANGFAGSGVTVRIQGQNSITKGNDPLYVIDGVPFSSQMLSTISGGPLGKSGGPVINFVASGGGNPLSYINPSDIESIDVLKDADATAIYGSRAANGVILITTKKGKTGKTKFEVSSQFGWGSVGRKMKMLNTRQYLDMRYEAYKNDGINWMSTSEVAPDLKLWDTTRYTDWQKTIIGGTALYNDISAAISGGASQSTSYLLSGTYHRETTVFPGDFDDRKGSLHFNLKSSSNDQKFKIQFSTNYMIDLNKLMASDRTSSIALAPNAPSLYNEDGTLNWMPDSAGASSWSNPLTFLHLTYRNKTTSLISNAILSYHIVPSLEIRSSFGYTNLQTDEFIPSPLVALRPENRLTGNRSSVFSDNRVNSWLIEPQISYNSSLGKGRFGILIGSTILQENANGKQLIGTGFNSDQVLEDIKMAPTIIIGSSVASRYKYNAVFARINYHWKDKYIFNLTGRRDGSSRFGEKNRFDNFGSFGASWIFTEEKFFRNNIPFISFGKLRASYGIAGNDQIGDYQFMNLYNALSVGVPYQNVVGLIPNGLTNEYFHWEKTNKLQFGFELGILNDRIFLTTNYVRNRSSKQLLSFVLPVITGFGSVIKNFPATIENKAWEFAITSNNIKKEKWQWVSSLNLTIPTNELVAFDNLATSTYASTLVVGQPISIQKAYQFLGVNSTTGIYEFSDGKGGGTSRPDTITSSKIALINTLPKFYGGFQNSFSYRGFQIDFLFQFVKQIGNNYSFGNRPGSPGVNQPDYVLNRWQKTGDLSKSQKYSSKYPSDIINAYNAVTSSNAAFSDASYIRLKNASVSWQLPDKVKGKLSLQQAKLFIHAQNLLTITNYKGLDPETRSSTTLPPLRVITCGFQLTF